MMKFKKIGKIFDPTILSEKHSFVEFAQSPQTLVFDTFVRIFFSTRTRDEKGEYLSHIAYIDMDLDLKNILNFSNHEIVKLGALGTYDEHGIFPFHPYATNGKIYAFLSGWNRRISVPVDTGIGLAESIDGGKTFTRLGNGPILAQSLHEPFLVGDGFVIKHENVYYMYYIFGKSWLPETEVEPVARVYKIGYATSTDLINWKKNEGVSIIADELNKDECQALPTVVEHNGKYHMVFCFREAVDFRKNPKRGYRLGYAYSDNLKDWTRADELLELNLTYDSNEWDGEMMCYPHLFKVNNEVHLLYNGNQFGKSGFGIAKLDK